MSLDVDSLNGEDLVILRLETGGGHLVGAQSASKSGVRLIQDHGRINVLCKTSSAFELEISKIICEEHDALWARAVPVQAWAWHSTAVPQPWAWPELVDRVETCLPLRNTVWSYLLVSSLKTSAGQSQQHPSLA